MLHLKNLAIATSRGAFGGMALSGVGQISLPKRKNASETLALRYIPEANILQRYDFVKEISEELWQLAERGDLAIVAAEEE
jgi:hypothetical protein